MGAPVVLARRGASIGAQCCACEKYAWGTSLRTRTLNKGQRPYTTIRALSGLSLHNLPWLLCMPLLPLAILISFILSLPTLNWTTNEYRGMPDEQFWQQVRTSPGSLLSIFFPVAA